MGSDQNKNGRLDRNWQLGKSIISVLFALMVCRCTHFLFAAVKWVASVRLGCHKLEGKIIGAKIALAPEPGG